LHQLVLSHQDYLSLTQKTYVRGDILVSWGSS